MKELFVEYIHELDDNIDTGVSKLFGMPDMPDNLDWPFIRENGDEYDLEFVGQIDTLDLRAGGIDTALDGLILFFFDLYGLPEATAAKVLYAPRTSGTLIRTTFISDDGSPDEDYSEQDTPAYRMRFSATQGQYPVMKANGREVAALVCPIPEALELRGTLTFYVSADDLQTGKFRNVRVEKTLS